MIKALWIVLSFQGLIWSEVYSGDLDGLDDEPTTPTVVGILASMAGVEDHSFSGDDDESEVEIAVVKTCRQFPQKNRARHFERDSLHNAFPPHMTNSQKRTSLINHQQWVLEEKLKTGRWKIKKGETIDEKLVLVQGVFEDVLKKFDGDKSIRYKDLIDRIGVSDTVFLKQYLSPNYYQRHLQQQAFYSGRSNQHPCDAMKKKEKETKPHSAKKRAALKPSTPPFTVDEESDDDFGGGFVRRAKVQARKKIKKSFEEDEEVSEEGPKSSDEESKIQHRASEQRRMDKMRKENPKKYAAHLERKREMEALRKLRLKGLLTEPE